MCILEVNLLGLDVTKRFISIYVPCGLVRFISSILDVNL